MKAFAKFEFDRVYTAKASRRLYAVLKSAPGMSSRDGESRLVPLDLVPEESRIPGTYMTVEYEYIDYRDRDGAAHLYMIPQKVIV